VPRSDKAAKFPARAPTSFNPRDSSCQQAVAMCFASDNDAGIAGFQRGRDKTTQR